MYPLQIELDDGVFKDHIIVYAMKTVNRKTI